MTAGRYDFTIEQGATFRKVLLYKDSANVAVNLTGYTARMQVRRFKEAEDVILNATSQNGKITIDGALGKITILISATDTNSIGPYNGVYDLEIEASNGIVTRLLEGEVVLSKQVTR